MAEDRGAPARLIAARGAPRTRVAGPPGPEELRHLRELLEAVAGDRSLLAQLPEEERRRLLVAAGRTVHPATEQKRRLVKAFRKAKRRGIETHDRSLLAGTGIRAARESEVFAPPPRLLQAGTPEVERPRQLLNPRSCYVCKAEYRTLHPFYDALCPACAELNYEKRFQTADLEGRVALVTGARVKIGYQAALKLLRAGATVVATTRFPHDAARRYAAEPDFAEWSAPAASPRPRPAPLAERRDLLQPGEPRAQAAGPARQQRVPDGPPSAGLLRAPDRLRGARRSKICRLLSAARAAPPRLRPAPRGRLRAGGRRLRRELRRPRGVAGRGSRARRAPLGAALAGALRLRRGRPAGGPLPRRCASTPTSSRSTSAAVNSWRLTLAEVSTVEMLEVQLVNAVAPFILCARLKPLMLRAPGRDKHVVNVSAMEGSLLPRDEDRPPPAHEHGEGGAQHADPHLRAATTCATGST